MAAPSATALNAYDADAPSTLTQPCRDTVDCWSMMAGYPGIQDDPRMSASGIWRFLRLRQSRKWISCRLSQNIIRDSQYENKINL